VFGKCLRPVTRLARRVSVHGVSAWTARHVVVGETSDTQPQISPRRCPGTILTILPFFCTRRTLTPF
jgi:hypothetical protein